MKKNLVILLFSLIIVLPSCQEEEDTTGNLRISFYPRGHSDLPASFYYYLYTIEGYDYSLPLVKLSSQDAEFNEENGRTIVVFNNINPGNYIFEYYRETEPIQHAVQVSAGKVREYELDIPS